MLIHTAVLLAGLWLNLGWVSAAWAQADVSLLTVEELAQNTPSTASKQSLTPVEPIEIQTDRPDVTETTKAIPPGMLQIENGFLWTAENGDESLFTAPETLFRVGLVPGTEIRLGIPNYTHHFLHHTTGEDNSTVSFTDLYLGFKQELGTLPGKIDLALIPAVTLPTGSSRISSHAVDPEVTLLWSRDFNERWSTGGLFTFAWPSVDGDHTFTLSPAVVLSHEFNDRWGALIEYFSDIPESGASIHFMQVAFTYRPNRRSQFDLRLGKGLTGPSPDYFIGGGYSILLGAEPTP